MESSLGNAIRKGSTQIETAATQIASYENLEIYNGKEIFSAKTSQINGSSLESRKIQEDWAQKFISESNGLPITLAKKEATQPGNANKWEDLDNTKRDELFNNRIAAANCIAGNTIAEVVAWPGKIESKVTLHANTSQSYFHVTGKGEAAKSIIKDGIKTDSEKVWGNGEFGHGLYVSVGEPALRYATHKNEIDVLEFEVVNEISGAFIPSMGTFETKLRDLESVSKSKEEAKSIVENVISTLENDEKISFIGNGITGDEIALLRANGNIRIKNVLIYSGDTFERTLTPAEFLKYHEEDIMQKGEQSLDYYNTLIHESWAKDNSSHSET